MGDPQGTTPPRGVVDGRRRGRIAAAIVGGAVVVAAVVAAVAAVVALVGASRADPLAGARFYRDPDAAAAHAAASTDGAERAAARTIAEQAAAIWLTPEQDGVGAVEARVADTVRAASAAEAVPVFVVYGVPERDCGGLSAGGLDAADYRDWIAAIDRGLGRGRSVLVLEPDALALAPECPDPADRIAVVREAARTLAGGERLVYLDGGHSDWLPAARMAALLRDAGVERTRGFALNIANMQPTDAETAYAHALNRELGGGHAVIDTSRNGNGASAEWCNPSGRALGDAPRPVDDAVVDALLWIKPPGESDGTCNGGPPAGQWWPQAAIELVANARDADDDGGGP